MKTIFALLIAVVLALCSTVHASDALMCNAKATTGVCSGFRSVTSAGPNGHKTVRVKITGTASVDVYCDMESQGVLIRSTIATDSATAVHDFDTHCSDLNATVNTCTTCTVTVIGSDDGRGGS